MKIRKREHVRGLRERRDDLLRDIRDKEYSLGNMKKELKKIVKQLHNSEPKTRIIMNLTFLALMLFLLMEILAPGPMEFYESFDDIAGVSRTELEQETFSVVYELDKVTLKIDAEVLAEMLMMFDEAYPNEAGGCLYGDTTGNEVHIHKVYEANITETTPHYLRTEPCDGTRVAMHSHPTARCFPSFADVVNPNIDLGVVVCKNRETVAYTTYRSRWS